MARFIIRGTLCALILATGICWADEAAYVDGTVTEIPFQTMGTLDLSGADALHFRYGSASYDLPFEQITRFHLGQDGGTGSQIASGAAKVGKTILPMLFSNRKRLTVNFRTEGSTNTQTLVFQLSGPEAKAALPVLRARTAPPPAHNPDDDELSYVEPTRRINQGSWWGNNVWRTERNKDNWPARPDQKAEASGDDSVEVAASKDE